MDCFEGLRKVAENLKVEFGERKYKKCLIIFKEKPQRFFALFVLYLITGAIHASFVVSIGKWLFTFSGMISQGIKMGQILSFNEIFFYAVPKKSVVGTIVKRR